MVPTMAAVTAGPTVWTKVEMMAEKRDRKWVEAREGWKVKQKVEMLAAKSVEMKVAGMVGQMESMSVEHLEY